jgi:hypothetical protein
MFELHAIIPPGRYFIGDPGRVLKPGLFQQALSLVDNAPSGQVRIEDAAVVFVPAAQALYPDRGVMFESLYPCESGKLGLVHESLLVSGPIVMQTGSIVCVTGRGLVTFENNILRVEDQTHKNLVHIDLLGTRRDVNRVQSSVENYTGGWRSSASIRTGT